jgi:thymidylate synthase
MNNLDKQYQALLKDILSYGNVKSDRTGTGTKSIFGYMIHHNMSEGFPLLTTKKVPFKTMATELMWFLMGDTNIKYLVENGCHIWDGDAYKRYKSTNPDYLADDEMFKTERGTYKFFTQEEFINKIKTDDKFAKKWGELGPIYGKQWRAWSFPEVNGYFGPIDQIKILIQSLKTNPDSRRLMVSAWNVGELHEMVLPPCHYGFQVYTRELDLEERRSMITPEMHKQIYTGGDSSTLSHSEIDQWNVPRRAISLSWNQRSVDVFLGLPFNIASYGLLLEMIAREVNMVPEHLIGNLGDTHLYLNHLEQAEQQLERIPRDLPIMKMSSGHNFRAAMASKVEEIDLDDFMLVGYDPHPTIKAPLSN